MQIYTKVKLYLKKTFNYFLTILESNEKKNIKIENYKIKIKEKKTIESMSCWGRTAETFYFIFKIKVVFDFFSVGTYNKKVGFFYPLCHATHNSQYNSFFLKKKIYIYCILWHSPPPRVTVGNMRCGNFFVFK